MAGNTLNEHVGISFSAVGSNPGYDGRQDEHGCTVVVQGGGKYKEGAKRGKMFAGATSTGRALPTSISTGSPLVLYNPVGSGVRAILKRVSVGNGATGTYGNGIISHGAFTLNGPTATQSGTIPTGTAVVPANLDIGGPNNSAMVLLEAATLNAAARELYPFISTNTEVVTSTVGLNQEVVDDLDGAIVLEPGSGYTIVAVQANSSSPLVRVGYVWEEEAIAA